VPRFTVTATTGLTPDAVTDALTDFGPRRLELWPNLDAKLFKLHSVDGSQADVTEGSSFLGGIWERLHYDWSTPDQVRLDVLEGNATKPGSFWEYRMRRVAEDRTEVSLEVDRRGRGAKGALLVVLLRVFGKKIFAADLRKSLDLIAGADAQAQSPTNALGGPAPTTGKGG
jgi:hypothetical protein